jgi:hypothetical protein
VSVEVRVSSIEVSLAQCVAALVITLEILEGPTSVQMRQVFAVQHRRARSKSKSGSKSGSGIGIDSELLATWSDFDTDTDTDTDTDFDEHVWSV